MKVLAIEKEIKGNDWNSIPEDLKQEAAQVIKLHMQLRLSKIFLIRITTLCLLWSVRIG
jgi:hypothetical protein